MTHTNVYSRAILAKLSMSIWEARKYDRKVSQEVAESHGADVTAGRYNKNLMPKDAESWKQVNSHLGGLRLKHLANTLPWSDDGWRILPIANYDAYTEMIRKGRNEAERLLDILEADYPALIERARIERNGLFNRADYPANIRKLYSIDVDFQPVPSGGDFRVELSQEEIDVLASNTESRVKAAYDAAQRDAVKRLYDAVAHIHERLTAVTKADDGELKPGVFRDSLITNARELCDVLTRLNLDGDPALEALRKQTELLALTEPETLRKNSDVRMQTAREAQSILDAMLSTYGPGVQA